MYWIHVIWKHGDYFIEGRGPAVDQKNSGGHWGWEMNKIRALMIYMIESIIIKDQL